jgi:hypothetical protein
MVREAFISVDWTQFKQALNPARIMEAYHQGLREAGAVVMATIEAVTPVFQGQEPIDNFQEGKEPGALKKSLKLIPIGDMIMVVSTMPGAAAVIEGHPVLSTPGQRIWFFKHYPFDYHRMTPGEPMDPVKANDFPRAAEIDVMGLSNLVARRMQMAMEVK